MIRRGPFTGDHSVRIGIVLPNWVGDCVMATPALRGLRQHFPGSRLIGVARPYLAPLLLGTTWLDQIHCWEHKGPGRLVRSLQLARTLRRENLDLLILLRASLSAALLARSSGAKRIVAHRRGGLQWVLAGTVPPLNGTKNKAPLSAVDDYLHLIASLGITPQDRGLELATTPADEAAADILWRKLSLPAGERVLLLNAGGAYGEAKHWPSEYCVSLALRAADEFGLTTLVLCGPQEREDARAIAAAARHPNVKSLADEDTRFGITKAIIRRSRLMVTTDSGPRHIAAAFNRPTIVLFGPIDPAWSRNNQADTIELRVPLDCAPCGQRTCPLAHHRCMRDLTVDSVLQAVSQILVSEQGTGDREQRKAA
jgi:heptosyltransferase-2